MAIRIRIGNAQLPIYAASWYALSGVLLVLDQVASRGYYGRLSIVVFLVGAVIHVLDKIDRCVGKVWDAGGRAERRRAEAEAAAEQGPPLAVVRTMAPRP